MRLKCGVSSDGTQGSTMQSRGVDPIWKLLSRNYFRTFFIKVICYYVKHLIKALCNSEVHLNLHTHNHRRTITHTSCSPPTRAGLTPLGKAAVVPTLNTRLAACSCTAEWAMTNLAALKWWVTVKSRRCVHWAHSLQLMWIHLKFSNNLVTSLLHERVGERDKEREGD